MNKRVWEIDNRYVPILLGIENACQKDRLYVESRRASILLGDVCALLITSSHSSDLDFTVSLLLKEFMGIQHHMQLFVGPIMPMHGNECIPEVLLFHFSIDF